MIKPYVNGVERGTESVFFLKLCQHEKTQWIFQDWTQFDEMWLYSRDSKVTQLHYKSYADFNILLVSGH